MRNSGSPAPTNKGSLGFSLIEMLIAVAIVSAVMAIVMRGIIQMQQRSNTESTTVDVSQQTRDFIDQMVRDIHNVGYPPPQVVTTGAPVCTANAAVACGVISYTPTQIIYEGDLDGSGTVYRVYVQLQPGAGGRCPCTLQRGAIRKSDALRRHCANLLHRSQWCTEQRERAGRGNLSDYLFPVQDRIRPTAPQTYSMPTMWPEER